MNPRTIGAGFVRNKVWDFLHEFSEPSAGMSDVDLVYFDPRLAYPVYTHTH